LARLIDDIRVSGKLGMPWCVCAPKVGKWEAHTQRVWDILRADMPIIKIDNVADYYFTASDQEHWDLINDFPNLAPPFELAWFEHRMPKVIHSREKGDSDVAALTPHGRVGMLMMGTERKDVVGENIPDNLRWALTFELFIDYGDRLGVQGPHGSIHFGIDAEGVLIDRPFMQTFSAPHYNEMMRHFITWTHPALLAISFMHCRNVTVVDESVPKPLAKKYKARTGQWPVRYKTLEIRPLQQILRREGGSETHGLIRAMHICRGHFKDYRQGKGLFGRYHQLVWQPAIVRGGKSEKAQPPSREYEVKL
jgi:hypothetical protein